MAKILIPPGMTFEETARQLASISVTLDRHQLSDGSFRAYVFNPLAKRSLLLTPRKRRLRNAFFPFLFAHVKKNYYLCTRKGVAFEMR